VLKNGAEKLGGKRLGHNDWNADADIVHRPRAHIPHGSNPQLSGVKASASWLTDR
jgi:hypothetical protein